MKRNVNQLRLKHLGIGSDSGGSSRRGKEDEMKGGGGEGEVSSRKVIKECTVNASGW